ncbi:MAG: hypothetical protein M0Q26_08455 [Chitinophagaceae bacterium]|nr:hypothetical protein [Chitinophagaceae bacterium]
MENLQYFILEEIYLRYNSRTGTELKRFIKEKLGKEPSDLEFTKDIKSVLDDLEEMKMIIWDASPMNEKGNGFPESKKYKELLGSESANGEKQTFENIYVEVQLLMRA